MITHVGSMTSPFTPYVPALSTATTIITGTTTDDLGVLPILSAAARDKKPVTFGEALDKLKDLPLPVPSVPLIYVNENSKRSNNIVNDDTIKKSVIKYYYYKSLEKWFFSDMIGILAFVKKDGDKLTFVSSSDDVDIKKIASESNSTLKNKIDFINEKIFTKDYVKKILKKIVKENKISWYDLYDNESTVKKILYNETIKRLRKYIQ